MGAGWWSDPLLAGRVEEVGPGCYAIHARPRALTRERRRQHGIQIGKVETDPGRRSVRERGHLRHVVRIRLNRGSTF